MQLTHYFQMEWFVWPWIFCFSSLTTNTVAALASKVKVAHGFIAAESCYTLSMSNDQDEKEETFNVHLPEDMRGGVYANTVNVNVTHEEVILDYILLNAQDQPRGTVVSRVVLSRKFAQKLIDTLKAAVSTANEVDPE